MKLCNIEDIPVIEDEKWAKLETTLYPEIVPMYFISTKGRIFNGHTMRFLTPRCLDPKKHESPYWKVALQVIVGNKHYSDSYTIHRLEMAVFRPVNNMELLVVNHIDTNKLNNDIRNSEWCTQSENTRHAIMMKTFIPVFGENHCCATISEYTADRICQLLVSRKYTYSEIANIIGTTESIVGSIATKSAWKHVSEKYDFECLKQRLPKLFTLDQIHACCEYFSKNLRVNESVRKHCKNALIAIGYNGNITESALNSIRLLYKRCRYTSISDNYDFY